MYFRPRISHSYKKDSVMDLNSLISGAHVRTHTHAHTHKINMFYKTLIIYKKKTNIFLVKYYFPRNFWLLDQIKSRAHFFIRGVFFFSLLLSMTLNCAYVFKIPPIHFNPNR